MKPARMSYYPYPPYPQPSLNPRAPTFQSHAAPSPNNMTHPSHYYQIGAPEVRNGVYQHPPAYANPPPQMYTYGAPAQHDAYPALFQQPDYPATHAAATYYPPPPFPHSYLQSQPHSRHDARHPHKNDKLARKDDPPRRTTIDEAQRSLPPAQRGYRPRHGDIITTYYPKTPAQLARENEAQARRDGLFRSARVEPEDRAPDRRWEVLYADGDRDYLTFAQIKHGFPGGEWRASETGQWRYHLGSAEGGRRGTRVQARGWTSGSDEEVRQDTGKDKGKGKEKGKVKGTAKKSRADESSADEAAESSESEVTSEHIRRWRAAWDDKY